MNYNLMIYFFRHEILYIVCIKLLLRTSTDGKRLFNNKCDVQHFDVEFVVFRLFQMPNISPSVVRTTDISPLSNSYSGFCRSVKCSFHRV